MRLLSIFGSRSDVIKMGPIAQALASHAGFESIMCIASQDRFITGNDLSLFNINPDYRLDPMRGNRSLNEICAHWFTTLEPVLQACRPDRVLVHGAGITAMAASLAAYRRRIPIAHVEAGLPTGNPARPQLRDAHRHIIDSVGDLLFAPSLGAAAHLAAEQVPGRVLLTGNTVIDAARHANTRILADPALQERLDAGLPAIPAGRRLLVVTGYHHGPAGSGFAAICQVLAKLTRRDDVHIVYPVRLNPRLRGPIQTTLNGRNNIDLVEPLDYLHFIRLLQRAHMVLTDSGTVQEEAPALGKPVLVMCDASKRPEAVAAGTVRLINGDWINIAGAINRLLDNPAPHLDFVRLSNPYGDGLASTRIVAALAGQPVQPFSPPPQPTTSLHGHA
ncbi:UDP-N-acetylglucosamine 2-epimerase (non-hydrolyzing) [Chitiniphilus purpureus]|uniref:UDP-N-acetylglucosamine 2-epimerase (non-hydrolyzing) n=1 Tax=Chitiniphilus purpureus TaxID=2981137 RepID=A0ABY6DK67_9NEIS|nr:UDP-N-acetylglucosamine 2-epimerase (non-hydrolyzing) [Chitiniphilus sp. CD1]UXY14749.1 UDP-N-acetylglucosamine 2-epimerase (non-hydrolyzing) [Chitiniphilus sp. CD1]